MALGSEQAEERISDLARSLGGYTRRVFGSFPRYAFDGTWPSVGALDLLCYQLRGKEQLSDAEEWLLQSTASCLALLAKTCWEHFAGVTKVGLEIRDNRGASVVIHAAGGEGISPGEMSSVDVTGALRMLLRTTSGELKLFEQLPRSFGPGQNLLSPFALGLCSGLCPFGQGPWHTKRVKEFRHGVIITDATLGYSSTLFYQRHYPAEQLGQKRALYSANLIVPPPGYNEQFPYARAAARLAAYLDDIGAGKEAKLSLLLNLVHSPDDVISNAAFVNLAAMTTEKISPQLLALSEAKRPYLPALRPALVITRGFLQTEEDWLDLLDFALQTSHADVAEAKLEAAKKMLSIEQQLGFLPLFRLRPDYLSIKELSPLFKLLTLADPKPASNFLEKLIFNQLANADLILQYVHLLELQDRFDEAHALLDRLMTDVNPPEQWTRSELALFYARSLAARGRSEASTITLSRMLETTAPDSEQFAAGGSELASQLFDLGRREPALHAAEQVLSHHPSAVWARITKLNCLEALEQFDEADQEAEKLYRMAASDRRVFNEIMRRESRRGVA